MRHFLRKKPEVDAKIEYTQEIRTDNNDKMIRIKLADWKSKQRIKENRKMLKGENIYIGDNATNS